ncbi:response regulator transcription factor [Candidatus Bipolaricaulota bacterium]|nr:response regulator transcription factor [Candidatus Bipolaricaulota bacterium]
MGDSRRESAGEVCVLLCEDNAAVAAMLRKVLCADGFNVLPARNKKEALELLAQSSPDLLLLDLVLPDSETAGWELLAEARSCTRAPIIVISGLNRAANRVRALRGGADDYVTKPFDLEELRARIFGVLRRGRTVSELSGLLIDDARKEVLVDGRSVSLSPKEFGLLRLLAASKGNAVRTGDILKELWPPSCALCATSQDAQKYVYLLRRKLESDPSRPRLILTVRGVGYRLAV